MKTLSYKKAVKPTSADISRFWLRVKKTDDCWLFGDGVKNVWQRFHYKKSSVPAHRFALYVASGEMPTDKICCHKCTRRDCVRGSHLYWGTSSDNARDIMRSSANGRLFEHSIYGFDTKLEEKDVIDIWFLYLSGNFTQAQIAKKYKVTLGCTSAIFRRKAWRRITQHLPAIPRHIAEENRAKGYISAGIKHKGIKNFGRKLTDAQAIEIRKKAHKGLRLKDLAQKYKMSLSSVYMLCTGKTYKNVLNPFGQSWGSRKKHKPKNTKQTGTKNSNAKLSAAEVVEIYYLYHKSGFTISHLARLFRVSRPPIRNIVLGISHKEEIAKHKKNGDAVKINVGAKTKAKARLSRTACRG